MASLDFEQEKLNFREYYNDSHDLLDRAKDSFISIIKSILSDKFESAQVIGRIKDREESISKFARKYQSDLEESSEEYEIKSYITDIIGLRVICLYESDIGEIQTVLEREFEVIDVTDKIKKVESSEGSFGYKGLHMDLRLKAPRDTMLEYKDYVALQFEVQIRTIIQDAWSVLDHKIKYKKSIPIYLKRRINVLAALFELADREFHAIREETIKLTEEEKTSDLNSEVDNPLNAFSFLAVAENKFTDYQFHSYKVDGFVAELNSYDDLTPAKFASVFEDNYDMIKKYDEYLSQKASASHVLNPYTMIRHVLYVSDKEKYKKILFQKQRDSFDKWLDASKGARLDIF